MKHWAVPLGEAVGSLQALLNSEQAGLQCRGGGDTGPLRSEAALPTHPSPAPSSHSRVPRFCAHSARMQQVRAIQHSAATAPLVGFKQAAQTLLHLLSLLFWGLLHISKRIVLTPLMTHCRSYKSEFTWCVFWLFESSLESATDWYKDDIIDSNALTLGPVCVGAASLVVGAAVAFVVTAKALKEKCTTKEWIILISNSNNVNNVPIIKF